MFGENKKKLKILKLSRDVRYLQKVALNAKVKMLRRINFLSTSILETFYYKIVIPSVLYGIVIWGSGPKFKDLEMIHIRAARLIHKLPTSFKDSDILSKVGWIPLEYFVQVPHLNYYI